MVNEVIDNIFGGRKMKYYLKKLKEDQRGIGIVEIILILVVLIALVIIFRDQITSLVSKLLGKIVSGGEDILQTTVTVSP